MDKIKKLGIKLTPQRIAVWNYIKDNKNHPCVETVYEEVRKKLPSVSFATIYSILESFRDLGLVKEIAIRKDRMCFDPNTERHCHFLCRKCNRIYDIYTSIQDLKGFKVENVCVYYYGVCKKCLERR